MRKADLGRVQVVPLDYTLGWWLAVGLRNLEVLTLLVVLVRLLDIVVVILIE